MANDPNSAFPLLHTLTRSFTEKPRKKFYWETQKKLLLRTYLRKKDVTEKQEQLWESSWSLAACLLVFICYSSVKLFSTIFTNKSDTVTKSKYNFGLYLFAWDSSSRFFYSSIHCFNLNNNNKSPILIN